MSTEFDQEPPHVEDEELPAPAQNATSSSSSSSSSSSEAKSMHDERIHSELPKSEKVRVFVTNDLEVSMTHSVATALDSLVTAIAKHEASTAAASAAAGGSEGQQKKTSSKADKVRALLATQQLAMTPNMAAIIDALAAEIQLQEDGGSVKRNLHPSPTSGRSASRMSSRPVSAARSHRSGASSGGDDQERKLALVRASPIVNDQSGEPVSDGQLQIEFDELDLEATGLVPKIIFRQYFLALENYGLPISDESFESQWNKICGASTSIINFDQFALFMLGRCSRM